MKELEQQIFITIASSETVKNNTMRTQIIALHLS